MFTTKIGLPVLPSADNELVAIASFAFEILPQFYHNWVNNLNLILFCGVNLPLIDTYRSYYKIPDQKGVTSVMNSLQNVVQPSNTKVSLMARL